MHKCLDSTLLILPNRIKHGFQIVRHYGNLPTIEGYPGLLSQVFINLLSNSLDALEEKGSDQEIKEITITTSLLDEDAVEIRIADNGPGISGDDRDKMFKTFLTTKPQGVGTGLGLANR
uniref:histidine kinase n=1 Tax=Planktothricoides sp. SpSt-374 TaxID=2282167 RepID=A0A7C3VJD4_9CYAN